MPSCIDVRRIGYDEIISLAGNRRIKVAAMQYDPVVKTEIPRHCVAATANASLEISTASIFGVRKARLARIERHPEAGAKAQARFPHRACVFDQRRPFTILPAEMRIEQFRR